MKPYKYSHNDTDKIDLDTKVIHKYPTPTKLMDIARMVVKGRHPAGKNTFLIEHDCNFVIYITKGEGTIYAGDEVFDVVKDDVVFVSPENKFACEGDMEYITVDTPAFYLEQSEIVEI